MMLTKIRLVFLAVLSVTLFLTAFAINASASHSWGGYHWARTSNPFTLKLGDNLSSAWDPYLTTTSTNWSASTILDTTIVPGLTNPRNCRATKGRVEVCNSKYGNNGWLGIAQIWISDSHIVQGVTKVNDTYFNQGQYNTPAWKNLVMCQEVGHTFGLDHQDVNFTNSNLGTCMDYTNAPAGGVLNGFDYGPSNEYPNAHDYEELGIIYAHLDSYTTIQSGTQKLPLGLSISQGILNGDFENRSEWGREIKNNRHVALYERDFGNGNRVFTFVIWAQE